MTEPTRSGESLETTVTASMTVPGTPSNTFDRLLADLETSLRRQGLRFEPGPDGRIVEDGVEVGRVDSWQPGDRVSFEWRPASWEPEEVTTVSIVFEQTDAGTRITFEHAQWGRLIESPADLVGWFAGETLTPLIEATAPSGFGDWLTDRQARIPAGESARSVYAEPTYHYPTFQAVLDELDPTPADTLLEVGCGGGAFLELVLERGCRAYAIDHSREMLDVTANRNRQAVENGQLQLSEATGDALPIADETVSCATMIKVLGLLTEPVSVLEELYRVLEPGGRIVIDGNDPELKGTIATPEPLASRLRFYDSDELESIVSEAGFEDCDVVRHCLEPYARKQDIPADHLDVFDYPARLVCATKR